MKPVGILIEDVPDSLRAAVETDAQSRDMNRNDVIVEILSRRFRAASPLTGYPYRPSDGSTVWNIRMSPELRDAIGQMARTQSAQGGGRISQRGLILSTLQAHYGLPVQSPRRRHLPALSTEQVHEARARSEAGESLRSLARRYGVTRATITRAIRAA